MLIYVNYAVPVLTKASLVAERALAVVTLATEIKKGINLSNYKSASSDTGRIFFLPIPFTYTFE